MELKDYTTEVLKAELDRRKAIAKAQKAAEDAAALKCRNSNIVSRIQFSEVLTLVQ